MAHGLFHDPDFDFDAFRSSAEQWKRAGAKRVIVEWQTGPGPVVVWYPAGERQFGGKWKLAVKPTDYNEQYADFLEYRVAPRLEELARANGLDVRINCVDQQPIQVMRMRRREIEHAQHLQHLDGAAHGH